MAKEAVKKTNDKSDLGVRDDAGQYNFWGIGGNDDSPWDALHAHFQSEASKDGGGVEEDK